MRVEVDFTEAAEADVVDALDWYGRHGKAVAVHFLAELDAAVKRISDSPLRFAEVHKDVRRILLRRFPYALFYRILDDRIRVLACFHTRRDPQIWRART